MLPPTLRSVKSATAIPANHSGTNYLIRQLAAHRDATCQSVQRAAQIVLLVLTFAVAAWGMRLLVQHANGGPRHAIPAAPSTTPGR